MTKSDVALTLQRRDSVRREGGERSPSTLLWDSMELVQAALYRLHCGVQSDRRTFRQDLHEQRNQRLHNLLC